MLVTILTLWGVTVLRLGHCIVVAAARFDQPSGVGGRPALGAEVLISGETCCWQMSNDEGLGAGPFRGSVVAHEHIGEATYQTYVATICGGPVLPSMTVVLMTI